MVVLTLYSGSFYAVLTEQGRRLPTSLLSISFPEARGRSFEMMHLAPLKLSWLVFFCLYTLYNIIDSVNQTSNSYILLIVLIKNINNIDK